MIGKESMKTLKILLFLPFLFIFCAGLTPLLLLTHEFIFNNGEPVIIPVLALKYGFDSIYTFISVSLLGSIIALIAYRLFLYEKIMD